METTIANINLTNLPMKRDDINSYVIKSLETFVSNDNGKETFGILIIFERNKKGTNGILISYNLMCATLVMTSLVNFLIDPKDSNRAAVLVALILVLATIFNAAQVKKLNPQFILYFHFMEMELNTYFVFKTRLRRKDSML